MFSYGLGCFFSPSPLAKLVLFETMQISSPPEVLPDVGKIALNPVLDFSHHASNTPFTTLTALYFNDLLTGLVVNSLERRT